jgi:hypothetical protein
MNPEKSFSAQQRAVFWTGCIPQGSVTKPGLFDPMLSGWEQVPYSTMQWF